MISYYTHNNKTTKKSYKSMRKMSNMMWINRSKKEIIFANGWNNIQQNLPKKVNSKRNSKFMKIMKMSGQKRMNQL